MRTFVNCVDANATENYRPNLSDKLIPGPGFTEFITLSDGQINEKQLIKI